jgi:hypothetical protein
MAAEASFLKAKLAPMYRNVRACKKFSCRGNFGSTYVAQLAAKRLEGALKILSRHNLQSMANSVSPSLTSI